MNGFTWEGSYKQNDASLSGIEAAAMNIVPTRIMICSVTNKHKKVPSIHEMTKAHSKDGQSMFNLKAVMEASGYRPETMEEAPTSAGETHMEEQPKKKPLSNRPRDGRGATSVTGEEVKVEFEEEDLKDGYLTLKKIQQTVSLDFVINFARRHKASLQI